MFPHRFRMLHLRLPAVSLPLPFQIRLMPVLSVPCPFFGRFAPPLPMLSDHLGQPASPALIAACSEALRHQLDIQAQPDGLPLRPPLPFHPPLALPPSAGGVSFAYFIMAHRPFAHATISRLLTALWSPAHLFLLHLDARVPPTLLPFLQRRYNRSTNVLFLRERRAVGWGAFSMVELLLRALTTALAAAPRLDFFINLSDADVALRTNGEMEAFLARHRGSSFVAVKFPEVDRMRYHAHAHMRRATWLECEGLGFAVVNMSASAFFGDEGKRCCYGRSGPIVYGQLPVHRPPAPDGWSFYHGSQWVVLSREAAQWMVTDPKAVQLARHLQLTYMSDETYVQTALMNSPFRKTAVNHNLRYIDWPHGYGDANVYWHSIGEKHVSGPMILTPELLDSVLTSSAMFARKVDLGSRAGVDFLAQWDLWMSSKLANTTREGASGTDHPPLGETERGAEAAEDPACESVGHASTVRDKLMGLLARQPEIAAGLSETHFPLSAAEAAEGRRGAVTPHAVHFGHEDVMEKQFQPTPPPPPAPLPPPKRREQGITGTPTARHVIIAEFVDGSSCSCLRSCHQEKNCCSFDEYEQLCLAWVQPEVEHRAQP